MVVSGFAFVIAIVIAIAAIAAAATLQPSPPVAYCFVVFNLFLNSDCGHHFAAKTFGKLLFV